MKTVFIALIFTVFLNGIVIGLTGKPHFEEARQEFISGCGFEEKFDVTANAFNVRALCRVKLADGRILDEVADYLGTIMAGAIQAFGISQNAVVESATVTGITIPGWLICDGASYPTSNFIRLFSIIDYTYGGSGAFFNVPNMQNKFLRSQSGGLTTFTAQASNTARPLADITLTGLTDGPHTHSMTDWYFSEINGTGASGRGDNETSANDNKGFIERSANADLGGAHSHLGQRNWFSSDSESIPKHTTVVYAIKY